MKELARSICKTKDWDLKYGAPLHAAALSGNLGVFQYLFEDSPDKNPKNEIGSSPIHLAAMKTF